jgi:hypothetical protein
VRHIIFAMDFINKKMDYEAASRAANKALRATCQLLQIKSSTKELPVALGCGVLLHYNSSCYLLTNAHVSDVIVNGNTFVLSQSHEKMTLGGQYYYTSIPCGGKRSDDTFDISVAKLDVEVVVKLIDRGHEFIDISDINTYQYSSVQDVFLLAGFPASKTSTDTMRKLVKSNPFFCRTVPYKGDLRKVNLDPIFHIAVSYPIQKFRDTITAKVQRVPNPHGMSGSGLWKLEKKDSEYRVNLVGILSEYFENKAAIVSTRIDLFIDLIRQKFDNAIPNNGIQIDLSD